MNKQMAQIAFLLLYCAGSGIIQAQTLGPELKKIRTAYLNASQLSFEVEVYSYATRADKTPELLSKGTMKKTTGKYYSTFAGYELTVNGEKAVLVDRQRKTLDYYEYETHRPELPGNYQVNIDSMMTGADSVVLRPAQNGLKHFTCFSGNGYVRQTEIYADAQTGFIKRILYYYIDSTDDFEMEFDRVEVVYKNIQTGPIGSGFFNLNKYVKKTGSTLTGIGIYRNYQINYHNSKR